MTSDNELAFLENQPNSNALSSILIFKAVAAYFNKCKNHTRHSVKHKSLLLSSCPVLHCSFSVYAAINIANGKGFNSAWLHMKAF